MGIIFNGQTCELLWNYQISERALYPSAHASLGKLNLPIIYSVSAEWPVSSALAVAALTRTLEHPCGKGLTHLSRFTETKVEDCPCSWTLVSTRDDSRSLLLIHPFMRKKNISIKGGPQSHPGVARVKQPRLQGPTFRATRAGAGVGKGEELGAEQPPGT